jgi:hypothetical protein
MKGKIRKQILDYIEKEGKSSWTVDHLSALRIDPSKLANAHYNMKVQGIIKDSGSRDGNKTIWELPTAPPEKEQSASYHTIGKQIAEILVKQDAQISADTMTIKQLTQTIADLQVKNRELAEKLNHATGGRVSVKEIAAMAKRSSLQ